MDIREFFFKYRGFTPVPFIIIALIFARPSGESFLWGLLLMIIGEGVRIWGVSHAGGATRTRNVGAPELITSGPFGYVRNPLYIGNMFMYTGAAVIANFWMPYLLFVVWVFFGIQYYLIVKLEEEKLTEIFGSEYQEYQKQVPRFIPRLRRAPISRQRPGNIAEAIRSEKSTFMSFGIILLLFYIRMRWMS